MYVKRLNSRSLKQLTARAIRLPYIENPNAYYQYKIVKPIENVRKGEIAPAFNQPDGGLQYE